MVKISKKQRVALKQIDEHEAKRKRETVLAIASIALMVVLIFAYNYLTYTAGIIDEGNVFIRGGLYVIAVVIAGFCGIMLMRANRNKAKVDAFRQSNGISRETLEAWRKGEVE